MVAAVGISVAAPARSAPSGPEDQPLPTPPPRTDTARKLYLRDCATCHGAAGRGSVRGPSLTEVGRASVYYYLTTGRMPLNDPADVPTRTEPDYPPEVIDDLMDYVAGLGEPRPPAVAGPGAALPALDLAGADAAKGGELYRLQCAACHAWSASGGGLLDREAPTLQRSTPLQVATAARVGPGTMPAFGENAFDSRELADLVAYVRDLQEPQDRGGFDLWHLGPLAEGGMAVIVGLGLLLAATRWIGERS